MSATPESPETASTPTTRQRVLVVEDLPDTRESLQSLLKNPNSIYADAKHPSAIVLGRLKGGKAMAPPTPCDKVLNEPCRANQAALPGGRLDLR